MGLIEFLLFGFRGLDDDTKNDEDKEVTAREYYEAYVDNFINRHRRSMGKAGNRMRKEKGFYPSVNLGYYSDKDPDVPEPPEDAVNLDNLNFRKYGYYGDIYEECFREALKACGAYYQLSNYTRGDLDDLIRETKDYDDFLEKNGLGPEYWNY